MQVLVAFGSKHGATAEIAAAIGEVLQGRGVETTVAPVATADPAGRYDAVILGSSVYAGHWTRDARSYVEANALELLDRPVWLFSSGPIGDPLKPEEEPVDIAEVRVTTAAKGHKLFAGKLDKSNLSFGERAIVTAFRAPEGDYRDWDEIERWAESVVDELEKR